jgi:phosphomethylpyrimidine synthase
MSDARLSARKTYLPGPSGLRVPMREIALTSGDRVVLYDTSGPYTDPDVVTDVRRGLPRLREEWIAGRGDVERYEGREVRPVDDGYRGQADRARGLAGLDAVFEAAPGGARPASGTDADGTGRCARRAGR